MIKDQDSQFSFFLFNTTQTIEEQNHPFVRKFWQYFWKAEGPSIFENPWNMPWPKNLRKTFFVLTETMQFHCPQKCIFGVCFWKKSNILQWKNKITIPNDLPYWKGMPTCVALFQDVNIFWFANTLQGLLIYFCLFV